MSDAVRFTLDTNILVYAFDPGDTGKQAIARAILGAAPKRDCHLTRQALTEFYAVVTRKRLMDRATAAAQLADWMLLFPTLGLSDAALTRAVAEAAASRLSIWDATLLAAADEGGCRLCLSEDMGEASRFGGVAVSSPFGAGGLSAAAKAVLGL